MNDYNILAGKKIVNKTKSENTGSVKASYEPVKRKSLTADDAIISYDLGRLKKSKLVNGEVSVSTPITPRRYRTDTCPVNRVSTNQSLDITSVMSMNFSHYELIRNLSNCQSECGFSGSTSTGLRSDDSNIKNEHLERYFRSVELWARNCGSTPTGSTNM